MFTSLFWKDAAERVVVTFIEAVLALFLVAPQTSVLAFDWPSALAVGATAAAISLAKALVAAVATKNTATVSPASLAPDGRGI